MEYPVRLGCSLLATRASGWLRGAAGRGGHDRERRVAPLSVSRRARAC
jgi:hypothetical protein